MAKKPKAKKNQPAARPGCMLLDSGSALLARGVLESEPDDAEIRVRVIRGGDVGLAVGTVVQVVPTVRNLLPRMGRVSGRRLDEVSVTPLRDNGAAMRKNFRMAVDFESFLYFREGGRATFRSLNLSSGGIALLSEAALSPGEICEVIVPITIEGPLLLDCEILRVSPLNGQARSYAAKFPDLIHDQEAMLREIVFQTQIQAVTMK